MLYPSKRYAQDLYRSLDAAVNPGLEFIVDNGANRCRATKGERFSEIVCLDTHDEQREQGNRGEAQYDIVFQLAGDQVTAGRSSSQAEIVAAVVCWMDGRTVVELYERFSFIGKDKRFFASIEEGLLRYSPELADKTTRDIHNLYAYSEGHVLWFRTPIRSCSICRAGYGDAGKGFKCVFFWNASRPLLAFPITDLNRSSQVLRRWLCDNTMPSQMRVEFPWLTIGTLADYYEAGRPVEGEFLESWESVERHYREMPFSFSPEVLAFIADIRRAGYDRTLRAGTSHYYLVVSRSQRHGLRRDQPRVIFAFHKAGIGVYFDTKYVENLGRKDRTGPDYALTFPEIKFTPAIADLLQLLATQEID